MYSHFSGLMLIQIFTINSIKIQQANIRNIFCFISAFIYVWTKPPTDSSQQNTVSTILLYVYMWFGLIGYTIHYILRYSVCILSAMYIYSTRNTYMKIDAHGDMSISCFSLAVLRDRSPTELAFVLL
jgi:hypothetical protein